MLTRAEIEGRLEGTTCLTGMPPGVRIVHAFVEGEEGELIEELKERITQLEHRLAQETMDRPKMEKPLEAVADVVLDYIEDLEQRLAQAEKVVEAATIFANRVDELAPKVNAAICFCHVHGQEWNRADSWEAERDALCAALAEWEGVNHAIPKCPPA